MADFRDVIYYPSRAFIEGQNPYNTQHYTQQYPVGNMFPLYVPHLLLISAPFALLPYEVSIAVFWGLNLLAYPLFAAICLSTCGIRASVCRIFLLSTALLASVPGRWNFDTGQLAVLLSIASVAAIHLAQTRPRLSAIALAVACVKPTYGIPLAMLMLAHRHTRVVLSAAALAGISAAIVVATLVLVPQWREDGSRDAPFASVLAQNQEVVLKDSLVDPYRTHTRTDGMILLIQAIDVPATYAVELAWFAACIGVCGWLLWRTPGPLLMPTAAAALMVLATTVSIYHQTYDAVLLAPVLVWLIRENFMAKPATPVAAKAIAAGLVAIPFLNVFWSKTFLGLLQKALPVANDTTMTLLRAAGWMNSIACLAALAVMAWLQFTLLRRPPAPTVRTPGSP